MILIKLISVSKLHQLVRITARGNNILDNVHTNIPGSYRALTCSHLGLSDHISLCLPPTYTQLIKRVKPTVKTVKVGTDESTAALQDCFESTSWQIFRDAATQDSNINLGNYTTSVITYIGKCVDDVVIMKIVGSFSNQIQGQKSCFLVKW